MDKQDKNQRIVGVVDQVAAMGLRLAGISDCRIVEEPNQAKKVFQELYNDDTIAIIITTHEIASRNPEEISKFFEKPFPVVVEIPSAIETSVGMDVLKELVKQALGMELEI